MERFSPSLLEEWISVLICASCWAYAFASSHICVFKVMGGASCISRNALCFSFPASSSSVNAENEGRKLTAQFWYLEPRKAKVEQGFHYDKNSSISISITVTGSLLWDWGMEPREDNNPFCTYIRTYACVVGILTTVSYVRGCGYVTYEWILYLTSD